MKRDNIIYWIATALVGFMGLSAGIMYFTDPKVTEGFGQLGFPNYFRIELGIAKLLGTVLILLPMVPARFKEWAYVGFGITFISAAIAHFVVMGPAAMLPPVISFAILTLSYVYWHKRLVTVRAA